MSTDTLLNLALFAGAMLLMMRFGCGACHEPQPSTWRLGTRRRPRRRGRRRARARTTHRPSLRHERRPGLGQIGRLPGSGLLFLLADLPREVRSRARFICECEDGRRCND